MKITDSQRIDRLERKIATLTTLVKRKGYNEPQPKLKQLDQNVFDDKPEHISWAVVTKDGAAITFQFKPAIVDNLWSWTGEHRLHSIINQYDASDWKNSLIGRESLTCEESDFLNDTISEIVDEIISSEYFYSKITCELLAKGCSYVLAYVSDTSEQNAIENKEVAVIESVDVLLNDTSGDDWKYAVPINNQGKPLTAHEAGL